MIKYINRKKIDKSVQKNLKFIFCGYNLYAYNYHFNII